MAKAVDPVISAVLTTYRLSEETRTGYSKRLALIAAAAGNNPLIPVLAQHPDKVLGWILKKIPGNWDPENDDCRNPWSVQNLESENKREGEL